MKIKLDDGAYMPIRAHATDAGLDLISPIDTIVYPGFSAIIDTGVHIELPHNTVGMLKSKSGLNVKHSIVSEGVIDEGYTGSIRVKLYNHGITQFVVHRGDKITQLVIMPCLYVDTELAGGFADTDRGNNGFGSTGK